MVLLNEFGIISKTHFFAEWGGFIVYMFRQFLISAHCINNLQKNISSSSNLQYTLKILTKGIIVHLQHVELKVMFFGSLHLCNFDQAKLHILDT